MFTITFPHLVTHPSKKKLIIPNQSMSFSLHIKQIRRTAFIHLHDITKIGNIRSQSDAEKLVHVIQYYQVAQKA